MPSLKGSLDGGRIIVDVGVQPALSSIQGVTAQASAVIIQIRQFRGLIDTGAQRTCITRSAARDLQLKPRGKIRLGNVSSIETHNSYSFAVGFWLRLGNGDTMNETTSYYGLDPVMGADFKDNSDFDLLIGMDVITQGDLTIRRGGTFEFYLP